MLSASLSIGLLCLYGFLKEFRPSEPFLFEFEHLTLNISEESLNTEVYPIWTYAYLVSLVPVFLLTDLLLYKPVVVVEALCYVAVWFLFDFGSSIAVQQIIESIYGCATATEIAYFAYLYVAVPKDDFMRATTFSRGALLAGRFCAYTAAQLIIALHWGDYRMLNWLSTGSLLLALLLSLALPLVPWRTAFHRRFHSQPAASEGYSSFAGRVIRGTLRDARDIYSDPFTLKWSLWWALATSLYLQVDNYSQTLWGSVQTEETQFNGITQALDPLLSIPAVLAVQAVEVRWSLWGEGVLGVVSVVGAGLMALFATTSSIFLMYGGFIVYRVLYEAMITIAQFNLATRLENDSFALVFGINTFVSLALQSIVTVVVVDKNGPLHLGLRMQFAVYGGCHVVVAVLFALAAAWTFFHECRKEKEEKFSP